MSLLTERIKSHFEANRGQLKGPIEVPEWGESEDKPLLIYFKIMNLAEQDTVLKWINEGSLKSLAQTVVTRSCDSNGDRLFRPVEVADLHKHADADVISRICKEMAGEDADDDDDPEKN